MSIRYINGIPGAPAALGPYSQATIIDNLVYLSGQVPLGAEGSELVSDGIEDQTNQVMKNINTVLDFLGIDFYHVLKTTIFLSDMNNFQTVNQVYSSWLLDARPARSTIQVAALPLGAKVEIETIACLEMSDSPMIPEGDVKELSEFETQITSCKRSLE